MADADHSAAAPTDPVPPEPFVISDPETLRAIAHPLRQQILVELVLREHGRAADLAKALDQPANAISFHLRVLAKAGLIVEAPELARDRRDRVWRPVAEGYKVDHRVPGAASVIDPYVDWIRSRFGAGVGEVSTQSTFIASPALLTRAEAEQLEKDISRVVEAAHRHATEQLRENPHDPDRVHYQVLFAIGPLALPSMAPAAD